MWTDEAQQRLEALACENLSTRDIAAKLGTTRNAVIGRARRTGVKLRDTPSPPTAPDLRAAIQRLWLEGLTMREICQRTGASHGTVQSQTRGLPRRWHVQGAAVNAPLQTRVRMVTLVLLGDKKPAVEREYGIPSHVWTFWLKDPAVMSRAARVAERLSRQRDERARREALAIAKEHAARRSQALALIAHARDRQMCGLFYDGQTDVQVAERFNLTRQRIHQIRHRLARSGVPLP